MRIASLGSFVFAGLLSVQAYAQNVAPAEKPALPAGHPVIPADKPSLPAGHPSVPGDAAAKPALPSGHPDLSSLMAPSTQPAATSATLTIHAVQSTKGAAAVGVTAASVDLYHRGQVIKSVQAMLDDHGVAVVKDLPVEVPFQPLVRIKHAGGEFRGIGEVMDSRHASQQVEVPVYQVSETAPAWLVQARHLMVQQVKEGFKVTEVLNIENGTDRAWLGIAQADGQRATVSVALPENAEQFQAGPVIDTACVKTGDGRVINTLSLNPGVTQMQYSYIIPMKAGQAVFTVTAPAVVKSMVMFVPDIANGVQVKGLEFVGAHDMGGGKQQLYRGAELKAGAQTVVRIAPPTAASAGQTPQ